MIQTLYQVRRVVNLVTGARRLLCERITSLQLLCPELWPINIVSLVSELGLRACVFTRSEAFTEADVKLDPPYNATIIPLTNNTGYSGVLNSPGTCSLHYVTIGRRCCSFLIPCNLL